MQPHQERVIAESNELHEKIKKLRTFIDGDVFRKLDPIDRDLLISQRVFMDAYDGILRQRIARFL